MTNNKKIDNILTRFSEARRIYGGSPAVQITYVDFARLYDDLEEIIELISERKGIGFSSNEE
jgi:hypothetical protein